MAEVLCVYREVKLIKEMAAARKEELSDAVAIVSYDEKPGIQAIATTAPDLPPEPGKHAAFARDHEYKRHGTVSLLAGIDLLTGQVHALVKDRHRSREFIEFLRLLDAGYPAHTAIKLILDNHSAHISKETKAWLANQPAGRFEFTLISRENFSGFDQKIDVQTHLACERGAERLPRPPFRDDQRDERREQRGQPGDEGLPVVEKPRHFTVLYPVLKRQGLSDRDQPRGS